MRHHAYILLLGGLSCASAFGPDQTFLGACRQAYEAMAPGPHFKTNNDFEVSNPWRRDKPKLEATNLETDSLPCNYNGGLHAQGLVFGRKGELSGFAFLNRNKIFSFGIAPELRGTDFPERVIEYLIGQAEIKDGDIEFEVKPNDLFLIHLLTKFHFEKVEQRGMSADLYRFHLSQRSLDTPAAATIQKRTPQKIVVSAPPRWKGHDAMDGWINDKANLTPPGVLQVLRRRELNRTAFHEHYDLVLEATDESGACVGYAIVTKNTEQPNAWRLRRVVISNEVDDARVRTKLMEQVETEMKKSLVDELWIREEDIPSQVHLGKHGVKLKDPKHPYTSSVFPDTGEKAMRFGFPDTVNRLEIDWNKLYPTTISSDNDVRALQDLFSRDPLTVKTYPKAEIPWDAIRRNYRGGPPDAVRLMRDKDGVPAAAVLQEADYRNRRVYLYFQWVNPTYSQSAGLKRIISTTIDPYRSIHPVDLAVRATDLALQEKLQELGWASKGKIRDVKDNVSYDFILFAPPAQTK